MLSKNEKILVTGGAGFIGSAVIWALNQKGYEKIIVADQLTQDDRFKNLVPLRFEEYIQADKLLSAVEKNDTLLHGLDAIIHLGACSKTTEKDSAYLIDNNYEYTKSLARWALGNNIRFVYASSAATYGDGSQGMSDINTPINTLQPLNMYAYSKHLMDLYAQRNGWLQRIVGLKYFNVFGPNEYHKDDMRSLIHKAYEQIMQTGKVSLFKSYNPQYKDGEQKRDFLYIKDAVEMTVHLAFSQASGLYNLGSGKAHSWNELVHAIFKALNKEPVIEYIPMPETLKAKYQYFTQADIQKLTTTGYKGRMLNDGQSVLITPLEESVREYVQEYIVPGKYLGQ